jgi:hypothetical protein
LTFLKSKKSIRFVSARPTRDPDDDAGSNEPEGLEREDDDQVGGRDAAEEERRRRRRGW